LRAALRAGRRAALFAGLRAAVFPIDGFGLVTVAAGLRRRAAWAFAADAFTFPFARAAGTGFAARRDDAALEAERGRTVFFFARAGIHEVYAGRADRQGH
jgi:hypothetical protein